MDDPRMELPTSEELANWFRSTREEHNVTQTSLADHAGISPSQISRVESLSGDASYETMVRLQRELLTIIERSSGTPLMRDVLRKKHETSLEEYNLVCAEPSASVEDVIEKMLTLRVSQLPVMTANGESVGRITERDLINGDANKEDVVETYMRTPFPEVETETPATIARDLLETNEAVLVTVSAPGEASIEEDLITAGGKRNASVDQHHYAGILTRADFTARINADD